MLPTEDLSNPSTAIIYSDAFIRHRMPFGHPECPERVLSIANTLKKASFPLTWLVPKIPEQDLLLLAHTPEYVSLVQKQVSKLHNTKDFAMLSTGDAVICSETFEVSLLAAGAVCTAVDTVMKKEHRNAFALVRPPGHHATKDRGMGFCIFNNVAIGARYLQKHYGIERVAIVDWDLHHGNGTEDIFMGDPSVLYCSTHQQGIYPGTGIKSTKHIINCPILAGKNSKDALYSAFEKTILPKLQEFQPQFLFISCGFDAHYQDPLGALHLESKDFYTLGTMLMQATQTYTQSRVVSVLEGGYNLQALAESALFHVKSLITASQA